MPDFSDLSAKGSAAPHPAVNALVTCEMVLRDQVTQRVSLIGLFENIFRRTFPARRERTCVYANLTDAQGDYELRLDLVRLEDLSVIGHVTLNVALGDRMASAQIAFDLAEIIFERPGRYEFRLYANNRWLGGKSFDVVQVESAEIPSGE